MTNIRILSGMLFPALVCGCALLRAAQPPKKLPLLKVSANHRFLMQDDGKPFFYLADTGWELFHRLNRNEAAEYLKTRAAQGYTVVQAVALAELDGLTEPNAYGKLPLTGKDPAKPAITPGVNPARPAEYDYWDHVDYIVDEANRNGIYIGLLPAWGRWVVRNPRNDETDLHPRKRTDLRRVSGKTLRPEGHHLDSGG